MTKLIRLLSVLAFFVASLGRPGSGVAQVDWRSKVDPAVLRTIDEVDADEAGEFLLFLGEQADLSGAQRLKTKAEKGQYVFEQLTTVANRTQGPLLRRLQALAQDPANPVEYRPFWVANMIWVRGGQQALQALARQPEVAAVYANPQVRMDFPEPVAAPRPQTDPNVTSEIIPWGVEKVGAPQVWALGVTGQGVVIGGQDTGYAWDHPALKTHYRGWNGLSADHNYAWHDAIHTIGARCPADSPVPCDDQGHGTHTMGTMVGDDGQGVHIGVAPGARWIGCRNMKSGVGTPATYSECYQWFIAPTDLNNANPRFDLAPDVINNSWSCTVAEGCLGTNPNVLLTVVEAVRAAGILTVHSAGNSGPTCSSISTPAAIYDASFTVGNTDANDQMASNSSRGPVTVDGSNRLKPDISAPGTSIYSSVPYFYIPVGQMYATMSGTSMAGPHVAGLAALLISANAHLRGQVDEIEDIMRITAHPLSLVSIQTCGSTSSSQIPNNIFGWGRINALKAVQAVDLLRLNKTVSTLFYAPGDEITYTLLLTHTDQQASIANVVVTDELPAGVSFVSATGPYELNGNVVTWTFPTLDPGESRSLQLVVQALPDPGVQIVNHKYSVHADGFIPAGALPPVVAYLTVGLWRFPLIVR